MTGVQLAVVAQLFGLPQKFQPLPDRLFPPKRIADGGDFPTGNAACGQGLQHRLLPIPHSGVESPGELIRLFFVIKQQADAVQSNFKRLTGRQPDCVDFTCRFRFYPKFGERYGQRLAPGGHREFFRFYD